ncbi:MAG: hypothetical protein SWX82_34385 [Cyanobacteriota bacterium]|nr:hypothetical protein [Cyanobacteriota bacterium]
MWGGWEVWGDLGRESVNRIININIYILYKRSALSTQHSALSSKHLEGDFYRKIGFKASPFISNPVEYLSYVWGWEVWGGWEVWIELLTSTYIYTV